MAVPRRICVADDEAPSRTMLRLILERWGYEVSAFGMGTEAYESLARPDGPRLALLDWMMPDLDGVSLCRRLRAEHADRCYYMVLVTARTDDSDVISALRMGADDVISKPFSPNVLQARVEVGFRTLDLEAKLAGYADQMRQLAQNQAAQLVHADRMASLGMISASVAHEINNPASFLSVNIQTLRGIWPEIDRSLAGSVGGPGAERALALAAEMPSILSEMDEGVSRIRQIVSELRTFSRAGHDEPVETEIDECVAKASRICSVRLKNRVELSVDAPKPSPLVRVDPTRIEQVFVNLIINAADAMDDSPERILSISRRTEGGMVKVSFLDTGPGVPADKRDSLFLPFFTTKPPGKGTGLGLHISRGLVEEFGGTLQLLPSPRGALFEVSLPAQEESP
jgi:two-component system NtrC family sensor kinase